MIDKLLKAAKTEDPYNPTDNEKAAAKNDTKEAYMAT